ncbi:MAG: urease accessory protein UreE [Chitinophagaceae bacterium]|nr:urease accessory protein UreE [Chitinophagaceae bacterium]
MIIKEIIGNIKDIDLTSRMIDHLELEWYETTKRILHKRTEAGKEISLKLLNQSQGLEEGDVIYEDEQSLIVVSIKPCESMVIKPVTMYDMAYICYEIGNKHLPLFYENDELLVPYEAPLFKLLQASGLHAQIENRKLLHQLKTTVSAHNHTEGKSLFSKILQLSSPNE